MSAPSSTHREVTAHLVALASLPGVGPATLLGCHRDPGAVAAWSALVAGRPTRIPALAAALARPRAVSEHELVSAGRSLDPGAELERHLAAGIAVTTLDGPGYPWRLIDDPAPPVVLFARGDLGALDGPTVALVGTRNATRAGRELARDLGQELATAGVAVISGLALGIDGAAHQGALRAAAEPEAAGRGRPVGVVAAGLDIAYPRHHGPLHRSVAAAGALVGETPMGVRPAPWRFPARNRIIAGLADAVVVVESRVTGGSILTAGEALERGTPVLAVPGHPSSPSAAGTNDLLFDGATIVRSAVDVLDAIGVAPPAPGARPASASAGPSRGRAEEQVLTALGELPAALPEIVERCGLGLEAVSEALLLLEARGEVTRSGGWYEGCANRSGLGRAGGLGWGSPS